MAVNENVTGNLIVAGSATVTGAIGQNGMAPPAQASVVSAIVTTQPTLTVFGFTTTAQFNALVNAVNSILTTLKNVGLMATS